MIWFGNGGGVAQERYEEILRARGFEILAGDDRLPLPSNPLTYSSRTRLLAARKTVGRATIDIELQETRSYNSAGLAGLARITGPGVAGEGQLRPRPVWGIWRMTTSGPKFLTYVLLFFLLVGVWAVMLPGILLFYFIARAQLRRQGLEPRPELTSDAVRRRYQVWSLDATAARVALPAALQEAIGATSWCGVCEVRDGGILLDGAFGYSRGDLFAELLTTCEKVAAVVRG